MNERRTTKIALLAMAVAATAPMMTSWNAEAEYDERLAKVAELKQEYAELKNSATTQEERNAHDAVLERLGVAERLIILENNGQTDTAEARALMAQMAVGMPTEADEDDATTQNSVKTKYVYRTYETTSQSRSNCYTQGTDFGKSSGSITAYATSSYLVTTSAYPSYISDGTVGQCENTSFDETVVTYNLVIDPAAVCIEYVYDPRGTVGMDCDEFGMFSLIYITSNAFYDGEAFKIPNAFTFVVV
ncbi:MAG: hypothetical protein OXI27_06220 [Thaumarchaeota archaeon]|nr:hypothetical protein [Nitrososphaerota archaeon]